MKTKRKTILLTAAILAVAAVSAFLFFSLREPALTLTEQGSGRVLARIHAAQYDMPVPDEAVEVTTEVVRIPMKQHIGAPAEPCVTAGSTVRRGDVIGRMADGALGADIHASVCGTVEQAGNGWVVIRADRTAGA